LVLTCDDQAVKLWEVAAGSLELLKLQHPLPVKVAAFSSDGEMILIVSGGRVRLCNPISGKPIGKEFKSESEVSAAALSPDRKTVLTGHKTGMIRCWNAASGKPLSPPLPHPSSQRLKEGQKPSMVDRVLFSPNGKIAASATQDQAQLWDTKTWKPIGQPITHGRQVYALVFNPDGAMILTGGSDRKAQLWEAATGKPRGSPMEHPDAVKSAAFSPDGKYLIIGCASGDAFLRNIETGHLEESRFPHPDEINALTFSPDGKTLLTGSSDRTARLWEVSSGRPLGPPLQHSGEVYQVAFSSDSRLALTSSLDWTARLWDVATGKPIGPPFQHQRAVTQAAFDPKGHRLLTGSDDGTVCLWNVRPPMEIGVDRLILWLSVVTGLEMDETGSTIQGLDAKTWEQRRQNWEKSK
jgi:WD40 repeat protein